MLQVQQIEFYARNTQCNMFQGLLKAVVQYVLTPFCVSLLLSVLVFFYALVLACIYTSVLFFTNETKYLGSV